VVQLSVAGNQEKHISQQDYYEPYGVTDLISSSGAQKRLTYKKISGKTDYTPKASSSVNTRNYSQSSVLLLPIRTVCLGHTR
jgi:hypothetical protein